MILSFLYIEKFRSLENASLNFDANAVFRIDSGRLLCELHSKVPNRFFSAADGADGIVDCVSAIIGRNGTGKTSVAALLNRILVRGKEDLHYVCVFKKVREGGRAKFLCIYNLSESLDDSDVCAKLDRDDWELRSLQDSGFDVPKVSVVYYSPYYNPQGNFLAADGAFIDISTASMLKSAGSALSRRFEDEEFDRVIRYIEHAGISGNLMGRPLPCPSELTISGNRDLIVLTQKNCVNAAEKLTGRVQSYVKLLRYKLGTLNNLPVSERGTLLKHGLFDWRTKEGGSACLHYLADSLDIGLLPCAFLQIVAGYIAYRIGRVDYQADLLPRTPHLMRLADLLFDLRNRIIARSATIDMGIENVDLPANRLRASWLSLPFEVKRELCGYCVQSLKSLRLEPEEWGMPSAIEMTQSWQDNFADVVKHLFEIMAQSPSHIWSRESVTLSIRKPEMRAKLYELLSAYRRRERDDFNDDRQSEFLIMSFTGMSSGELAFISMFARLYELLNPPLEKKADHREIFNDAILFMDEVETALHPEWQRCLVNELIGFIEAQMPDVAVHLIFASHSPMLLSDIPIGNVCFLEQNKGRIARNAFGANIFDLYRNGFGVDSGTWGVFAEGKIRELFAKLKNRIELSNDDKKVIDLIGDKFIRTYIQSASRKQGKEWRKI